MLLGTSPPASAFMPMSADASSYNCSTDDVSTDSTAYGLYGRIKTFPVFPPKHHKNGTIPAMSVHRRTTTYNLSLQDIRQLTNLFDDGCMTKSPSTPTDLKKVKKKVVFADDRGLALAQIKFMTEPSDVPPKIRSSVFRALLGDKFCEDEARPCSQWTLTFKQPASDYLSFRRKLDERNVALENVLLKNEQCRIAGTVKVKNISFEKTVFVRFTDNKWQSFVDYPCLYSPHVSGGGGGADGSTYDTFQFDFEVPCDDENRQIVEFCVGFRANNNEEFWDSNNGDNFKIVGAKYNKQKDDKNDNFNNSNNVTVPPSSQFTPFLNNNFTPTNDAFTLDFNNWTQFASWNHLTTEGPYW